MTHIHKSCTNTTETSESVVSCVIMCYIMLSIHFLCHTCNYTRLGSSTANHIHHNTVS